MGAAGVGGLTVTGVGDRRRALAALGTAAVCWGLVPVANRFLVQRVDPLLVLSLRFAIAWVLFLPVAARGRWRGWSGRDLASAATVGVIGIVGYNLPVAYGLAFVPAGIAGLLLAIQPLWILLLAVRFGGERLTRRAGIGSALATLGVVLVVRQAPPHAPGSRHFLLGVGLILVAAILWATYTVAVRPLSRRHGAVATTAFTNLAGALPFVVLLPLRTHGMARLTGWELPLIALLAVASTVIGTLLWNFGLTRVAAAEGGLFLYALPVVSVLGGLAFLAERPTTLEAVGGLLVVGGVAAAHGLIGPRI